MSDSYFPKHASPSDHYGATTPPLYTPRESLSIPPVPPVDSRDADIARLEGALCVVLGMVEGSEAAPTKVLAAIGREVRETLGLP